MSHQRKRILSWTAVVLWAAFIFFMSAHTGADLDEGPGLFAQIKRWLVAVATPVFGPDTDIVSVAAHFSEYLVFGVLLFIALRCTFHESHGTLHSTPRELRVFHDASREPQIAPHEPHGTPHEPPLASAAVSGAPRSARFPLWALALAAIAIASLYGVTDEFHQSFVPNRMCDPADWLTDTLGATLGAGVASAVSRFREE